MDATIADVMEVGQMHEVLILVQRLRGLPEFGMESDVERIEAARRAVEELERQLSTARLAIRDAAIALLVKCQQNWTGKEITTATGYPVESKRRRA